MAAMAAPEPASPRTFPVIGAAVARLYRVTKTGPPTSRTETRVPIGTIRPHLFRTWSRLMSSTRARSAPSAWTVTCQ